MQVTLYSDLARRTESDSISGGAFAWPPLVEGDTVKVIQRFVERVDGTPQELDRDVRAIRCGLGRVDAQPTGGTFKLRVYDETGLIGNAVETAAISATETAAGLEAILTASGLVAEVTEDGGSWLLDFLTANVPEGAMEVFANNLTPAAFVRIVSGDTGTGRRYELRAVQAPVAFTDEFARVLPPPPAVHTVTEGQTVDLIAVNEVQSLYVHPLFRGIYRLRRGDRVTGPLSREDDEVSLEAACSALLTTEEIEAENALLVSLVTDNTFFLEFAGPDLGGTDEAELTVEVLDAPLGDVVFALPLDTLECSEALRGAENGEVELMLEIEAEIADDTAADAEDESVRLVTLYRGLVTLVRDVVRAVGVVSRPVDWQKPRSPETYRPFTRDQLFFGSRHQVTQDLEQGESEIEHGLDSEQILHTLIDTASGAFLAIGVDYSLTLDSADSVTIDISGGVGPYTLILSTAGAEDHFQAHTHTTAQVVGLDALLLAMAERIARLEELIPSTVSSTAATDGGSVSWPLPALISVLPARKLRSRAALPVVEDLAQADTELAPWLAKGGLLPAIYDAAAEALPSPAPVPSDPSVAGKVYQNTSSGILFGVEPEGFLASNGRRWYELSSAGAGAWYPREMERELWKLGINERQHPPGTTLSAQFGIETVLLRTTYSAQWVLVVEHGTFNEDAAFGDGYNLEAVDWVTAEPLLEQRINVTGIPQRHDFGLSIVHNLVGETSVFAVEGTYYGHVEVSDFAPPAVPFALRARLIKWDTEDSAPHGGYVLVQGLDPASSGSAANPAQVSIS